ncbi:imidazole glycerol phosphate synthase subunit HisF [Candidatus Vidania fulgoroideorum]
MISKRIIACLDVYKNIVVKGKNFLKIKKVNSPKNLSYKYYKQKIDEIVFLNIKKEKISYICKIIKNISKKIFIPITVGGNIKNIKDIKKLMNSGADKIALNSTLYYNLNIVKKIKKKYGSQILVASIDVKKYKGEWIVYINGGKTNTKIKIKDWCMINYKKGIGEFLLTSIDMDGTNKGYDIELYKKIEKVNTPIISSGGGGNCDTLLKIFKKTKTSAALLASALHYKKNTIKKIKKYLFNFFFIR